MQSSVRNSPVVGACVGSASLCSSMQESVRRSGTSSSTCVGSATPFPSRICPADERTDVPAVTLSPNGSTCVFPVITANEARTSAGLQRNAHVDVRRSTTSGSTRGGSNRNRRAAASRRVSDSYGTYNRRGVVVLRLVRTSVDRLRRWMARYSARHCQGLPLPHAVADVRRFLDALYYEEICFLILRSCLTLMHTGVLLYSCVAEEPFQTHVPVAPLLAVLSMLTLLRVLCQYHIVRALSRLRWAWWQRTILADFVKLLRSPLWQCQRVLFVVSFSFYFVALHLAYYRRPSTDVETSRAPVLMRYVSLVVLAFLSVLGPHILMLVIVCTSLIVCWWASAADIEQLLVEEPRGAGRALPARLLQMMHEEQWTPPEPDRGRSSNINNGTSNSRRGSDATHVLNRQLQEHEREGGRTTSSLTRTRECCKDEQEGTGNRKNSCESSAEDTRGPHDNDEERVRNDFTCAICLTEFHEGDVVRRLPCSHVFHSACITRWLSSHASCPLRCYVNFFTAHMNQPSYDANRHLRVLGTQLLRRPRFRVFGSFRQRHERQLRERLGERQRANPQRQPQQLQQQGEQGRQQNQDQQQCAVNQEEEKQEDVQSPDDIPGAPSSVDSGAADHADVAVVAEPQLLVDQVDDRITALAAATELHEHICSPKLQRLSSATLKNATSQDAEEISKGVNVAAEALSEGREKSIFFPCSADEANEEEEHEKRSVPVAISDPHLQEECEKLGTDEEGRTGNLRHQDSPVYMVRAALQGSSVSASLESTVAVSLSSGDGFSEYSPLHCEKLIFSQDDDV